MLQEYEYAVHDGMPQSLARVGCPLVDELSSDVAPGGWVLGPVPAVA